jgi:hypothetical protein
VSKNCHDRKIGQGKNIFLRIFDDRRQTFSVNDQHAFKLKGREINQMKIIRNTVVTFIPAFIIAFTAAGCSNGVNELVTYLDQKEAIYESISVDMGIAYWNLYSDEDVADLEPSKQAYFDLYNNDTLNALVDKWYKKRYTLKDPVLKRRLVVWHNILTAAKVNYSKEIYDLQSELELWLSEEDTLADVPSQEELEAMVLKLMRMRNEKARTLGYDNFAHLMLDVTELRVNWLEDFFAEIDKRTLKPYQDLLNELKAGGDTTEITFADVYGMVGQLYASVYSTAIDTDSIESYMIQTVENIGFDFESLPVRFLETISGSS